MKPKVGWHLGNCILYWWSWTCKHARSKMESECEERSVNETKCHVDIFAGVTSTYVLCSGNCKVRFVSWILSLVPNSTNADASGFRNSSDTDAVGWSSPIYWTVAERFTWYYSLSENVFPVLAGPSSLRSAVWQLVKRKICVLSLKVLFDICLTWARLFLERHLCFG